MTRAEINEKLNALLGTESERAIIADSLYKWGPSRSYSLMISDSKEDGFSIPYEEYTEKDKSKEFAFLLKKRKESACMDKVRKLLRDLKDELHSLGLELRDDDLESLVKLEKPVIMVQKKGGENE